jgi:hypothetical protein
MKHDVEKHQNFYVRHKNADQANKSPPETKPNNPTHEISRTLNLKNHVQDG